MTKYLSREAVIAALEELHDITGNDDKRDALWDAICHVRALPVASAPSAGETLSEELIEQVTKEAMKSAFPVAPSPFSAQDQAYREVARRAMERFSSVLLARQVTLPEPTPDENLLARVKAFVQNVKNGEPRFGADFVTDGVLAIIDDGVHLEALDFGPLTEADIAIGLKVAKKLGFTPGPVAPEVTPAPFIDLCVKCKGEQGTYFYLKENPTLDELVGHILKMYPDDPYAVYLTQELGRHLETPEPVAPEVTPSTLEWETWTERLWWSGNNPEFIIRQVGRGYDRLAEYESFLLSTQPNLSLNESPTVLDGVTLETREES